MPKKFVLIDAYSIIYRSYYAFINNPLKNSKGETTSGIFGFLNTLEKIKQNLSSNYMGLAFDAPGKTFRDEVFEEYKATRLPPPEDIPFQIEKVKEICTHLGIPGFEKKGFEADDILATFALILKEHGDVYIVTSDKDLFQLVCDNVYIYDAYKNTVYDVKKVVKKYGVPPNRIGDYLALTGDSIDNIPGVPGIGPKRAVDIIQKYGSFEEALQHDKRIIEYKEQALLSRKLVELERKVPLTITPQELVVQSTDIDSLMPILLDLELHSYIKILSAASCKSITAEDIKDLSSVTVDKIIGIAIGEKNELLFCPDKTRVYAIPLKKAHPLLSNPEITKVGYEIKNSIKKCTLEPPYFDVAVAAWLIDPNRRSFKFEDIVLQFNNAIAQSDPASIALHSTRMYASMIERLDTQYELYRKIEEPLIPVLARMEQRGVKIDKTYLTNFGDTIQKEITTLQNTIFSLAGLTFNINSPKQLSHILFEKLKLKPMKRGKKHYSTSVDVLQQLSAAHPLPKEILRYRELSKIRSTYVDPLLTAAENGRVHTTFNQTVTSTGRLSSSNPNLQNIPIRSDIGREIRKGFIAEPGYSLISVDYSQIELRILAHISQDKILLDAFAQNKDIHRHTASLVFNISEEKVNDKQRRMAKVVNYGLIYGMSDYGLAQGLDIPQEDASQFIQDYYNLYASVAEWRDKIIAMAEEKGYSETMLGRRRPLPDIQGSNHSLREFSKRAAINTPIQGTAADLIKLAMISVEERLTQEGYTPGLLLSIHDELVFEIEDTKLKGASQIIRECMENALPLSIPTVVTLGIGKTWAEAH